VLILYYVLAWTAVPILPFCALMLFSMHPDCKNVVQTIPNFRLVTGLTWCNSCWKIRQKPRTCVHVCEQDVQNIAAEDVESNSSVSGHISTVRRLMKLAMSQVFVQSCVLTFLAEWGDRSQISTIILAARDVSACLWHQSFCTFLFQLLMQWNGTFFVAWWCSC